MPTIEAELVQVAAGIVWSGDKILIAKRPDHLHKGGLWEFPGGKINLGETSLDALDRELKEELGIDLSRLDTEYLFNVDWQYPEKRVQLSIYLVKKFSGQPFGKEGQQIRWVSATDLDSYHFPEANVEIVAWVQSKITD